MAPPSYRPTKVQRQQVEQMRCDGMSEEAIAAAIGIHRTTLRLHFADELMQGRAKVRQKLIEQAHKAAKSGNITAIKFLLQRSDMTPDPQADIPARQVDQIESKPVSEKPLGKKEQAKAAALLPPPTGGRWADIEADDAPMPAGTKPN